MSLLLVLLYVIGLYGAFIAGSMQRRTNHFASRFHFPRATLLMTLAIAIPTTLQFFFPVILNNFERDTMRFLSGDWWRIITPLFVQDGGLAGSVFNLVSLLLVGSAAEQLWGGRKWIIIFLVGGILGELVAFAWQPVGAGNSVANFSLAASVAVFCFAFNPPRPVRIASALALGACAVLLFLKDIHGAAALIGSLIAIIMIWFERRSHTWEIRRRFKQ